MKDGQETGGMLLDIESAIGKWAIKEEQERPQRGATRGTTSSKPLKHQRLGLSPLQMARAEKISKHPEVVEKVKKQARRDEAKIENLLFVIYVQDQRHDYWMKVIKETKGELEKLKEEMGDGDKLFNGQRSGEVSETLGNHGLQAG